MSETLTNLDELIAALEPPANTLIIFHRNPDADAIGSAFSLRSVLEQLGSPTRCICQDEVPQNLRFLTNGVQESVLAEAVLSNFEAERIISVDTASLSQMGTLADLFGERVDLAIDHHEEDVLYGAQNYIRTNAAAAGEIVFDVIKHLASEERITIDEEMCVCLYAAISADTGCFRYSNVTPKTHIRAAELVSSGIDCAEINRRLFENKSLERLRAQSAAISNMEKPLFGVFKTPQANNIDLGSPYGVAIFSEAIQELRDLDIAYSRNSKEIKDSKRTDLLDSDRLLSGGIGNLTRDTLPDYIKLVDGDTSTESDVYHEINPTLNTDTRLTGINALLSQIGYKVGFSNGYFVFNESTGIQTATQVEADQQRTIQFIKDVRDKLESCLDGLIYALDVFASLYKLAPSGKYKVVYGFGDITYNVEEDRARWWGYVQAGKVPAWMYFVKFEGMTDEDAKAMTAEAEPKTTTLFE